MQNQPAVHRAPLGGLSALRGCQFLLARVHLLAERLEIHFAGPTFRKQLAFLFPDVVVDVFTQDLDLRIEERLSWHVRLDLRNQVLGAGMFHFGFIEQIVVFDRFVSGWIKDLLLDLRVDGRRH